MDVFDFAKCKENLTVGSKMARLPLNFEKTLTYKVATKGHISTIIGFGSL